MVNLNVAGRAAHSGYPELGVSAIRNLLAVLDDCERGDWGDDPVLGKGTFNTGVFHGGEAANIVPPHATASVLTPYGSEGARTGRQPARSRCGAMRRASSSAPIQSTANGKCGPCCSTAPSGSRTTLR